MICQILRGKGRILGIVSKRKRRTWLRYNLLESNSWRLCHIRISCMWLRSSVIVEWLLRHRRERRSRRLWWGWACSSWIWIKDFSVGFGRLLEDRSRLDDFSLRNSSPFYRRQDGHSVVGNTRIAMKLLDRDLFYRAGLILDESATICLFLRHLITYQRPSMMFWNDWCYDALKILYHQYYRLDQSTSISKQKMIEMLLPKNQMWGFNICRILKLSDVVSL